MQRLVFTETQYLQENIQSFSDTGSQLPPEYCFFEQTCYRLLLQPLTTSGDYALQPDILGLQRHQPICC